MSSKSERSASFVSGETSGLSKATQDSPTGQTARDVRGRTTKLFSEVNQPPGFVPSLDSSLPHVKTTALPEKAITSITDVDEPRREDRQDKKPADSATPRILLQVHQEEPPNAPPRLLVTPAIGQPPELQHIQIGQTVLPYLELGRPDKDKPSWVMAPGISSGASSLWDLAEEMGELMEDHIVIFEAPKEGVPNSPGLPWYAKVTAEAAKQVTDRDKINAVGHSWGGMLVQEMAHGGDVKIERMGILASLPLRPHTSLIDVLLAIPSAEMMAATQAIRDPNRNNIDPGLVYGGIIRDNPAIIAQYEHLVYRDIDERSHANQLNAFTNGLIPLATKNWMQRVVRRQGPPTLVVIGRRDPVIPHAYASRQATKLGMVVYSIDDGHLHPITSDVEVAGVLQEFTGTPAHELSPNWRPRR